MTVKSKLLETLECNKGKLLSGEHLAEEIGCTRAAVWKAVRVLREDGYPIEAEANKGYTLLPESNLLSAEAIHLHLKKASCMVTVCREVDSTNQAAKKAAMEGNAQDGDLIVAQYQRAGRGRRGRKFYSPEKAGIYMSVILRPEGKIENSLFLTTSAATAVYRAVKRVCGLSLDIKWVNDLYFRGKKVCGILTEAVTDFDTGDIEFAVVGIGLNLYLPKEELPGELLDIAGGLYDSRETAEKADRNFLVGEIVNCLMEEIKENRISDLYIQRNIVPGKEILIREGDEVRNAFALEICPDGKLLIQERDGERKMLSYGEISVQLNKTSECIQYAQK